jgi:hypothetical protein
LAIKSLSIPKREIQIECKLSKHFVVSPGAGIQIYWFSVVSSFVVLLYARATYSFSKTATKIVYERDIVPYEKWYNIFLKVCDVYRDICKDLGIVEIADSTIRSNVKAILHDIVDLRTEYTTPGIPRVDLKELFGE